MNFPELIINLVNISCLFNKVECTSECNCISCQNPHGKNTKVYSGINCDDSAKAPYAFATNQNNLPPLIQPAVDQRNETPYMSTSRAAIEHYPYAINATSNDTEALQLQHQKEANYNSAIANLLSLKNMLLQSKYKMHDLEHNMGKLEESGASKATIDRQMIVLREVLQNVTQLSNEVRKMEADIATKYD